MESFMGEALARLHLPDQLCCTYVGFCFLFFYVFCSANSAGFTIKSCANVTHNIIYTYPNLYATATMASKLAKFNKIKLPSIIKISNSFSKLANVTSVHNWWKTSQ